MDRRKLLKTSLAGSAAAMTLPRLASAQTPAASPAASPAAGIQPVNAVQENGHYPSGNDSVPDAWTKMPEPFAATDAKPLNGGEVTALVMTYSAPPTPKEQNAYWKGLDERLGGSWNPTLVPYASYGEKASAVIASGDMPDLFYLNPGQTSTPLQKFIQEGAFLDLTEYVTGDAINEYPNLATFPEYMWNATKTDGKIYGVPTPEVRVGKVPAFRVDWSDKLLGKRKPENAQEMHDVLVAMSMDDPDGNGEDDTFGISKYGTGWDVGIFHQMFNVPPLWKVEEDGSFTVQYEMPEFREALTYIRQLYTDGAYHPDAAAMGFEEARNLFRSGRSGLHNDGGAIYGVDGALASIQQYQPEAELESLIPFNKDGGPGITYLGTGTFGMTALPYSIEDPERVKELLRLLDWFSSPFGSEEWMYKNFGDEGTHFTFMDNGFPEATDVLEKEAAGVTGYMGGSLIVNWNPQQPELAPLRTDEQNQIFEIGVANPADGLYSPAFLESSGQMFQTMFEGINEIVVGRAEVDTLDQLVERWKSDGGEQAAQEYSEAYKANQEGQ